jgi:hypothetical protein
MPNRRSFLGSLAALIVAPFVPIPAVKPPALAFHPKAFAEMVMAPLNRQPMSMVKLAREAQQRYDICLSAHADLIDQRREDEQYLAGDQWSAEDRQARA